MCQPNVPISNLRYTISKRCQKRIAKMSVNLREVSTSITMSQKRAAADCADVAVVSQSRRYFVGDIKTIHVHQIVHHTQVIALQHVQSEVNNHEGMVDSLHVHDTLVDDISGGQIKLDVASVCCVGLVVVHSKLSYVEASGDKQLSEVDVDFCSTIIDLRLRGDGRFIDDPTTANRQAEGFWEVGCLDDPVGSCQYSHVTAVGGCERGAFGYELSAFDFEYRHGEYE